MKSRQVDGELNTFSITAAAAITKRRFVAPDGTHTAAAKALGVAQFDTDSGDEISVLNGPVEVVEAGAAISAAGEVEADSVGRAITLASGESCGYTPDTASAAGELIRVYRTFS